MDITTYVLPELAFLTPFLYLIGLFLKHSGWFSDRFIPLALGVLGMVIATVWLCVATPPVTALTVITGIIQGVLYAGLAVYANQLYKQATKGGDFNGD